MLSGHASSWAMALLYSKLSLTLPSMVHTCTCVDPFSELHTAWCVCVCVCVCARAGVVLGVVCHGGLLLTSDQLTAGQLMAFLVATQTIQRYESISRVL